ncbi:Dual specificity protein kinase Ttk [Toxocara canis]|uniref:Dual specificity protein kinase Ttk n=2 Tax=Toxocara canis TaxID=6265 RepID=A0A0B2VAD3_TOXCA|nr:Dual specificity protein kinase Ttk [Toxocara canis]VDM42994.1 unnamed protein product [Toxocara canis]
MSTARLRERLRQIQLRTATPSDSVNKLSEHNDSDRGNNATASKTDGRLTKTAPVISTTATSENFVAPTASVSRPVTSSAITSGHMREGLPSHRPISVIESGPRFGDEKCVRDGERGRRINVECTPRLPHRKSSSCESVIRSSSDCQRPNSTVNGKHVLVNGRKYLLIDQLGKGGSSKVYQVLDVLLKKCQALKFVDLSEADSAVREAYLNEIKLLVDLKNSGCVVQLFDYELRGNHLYMVMEKGDTDLATFLNTRRNKIDHIFIRFYWSEMLKCVNAIHNKGVVHSDLKPANFLLVGGNLKLIDFGIASSIPSNRTSVTNYNQMGTLSYMPPEALADSEPHQGKVNRKSDVWSLGCILYNMVYGRTPYQHFTSIVQKINAIVNKPVEFDPIDDLELLDVMKKCLTKDPIKRASVEELQRHPYLKNEANFVDEAVPFMDESYLLRVAEDLRNSSPHTSACKLRWLMQKRGTGDSAMKMRSD